MFKDAPNNYRDPYWTNLARQAASKHGVPTQILENILLKGERSNANQTSSAGARTPFQIIPQTRQGLIKNYGIDPWLSPQNAAEGAALLLAEAARRNSGDWTAAVREYHGGRDPRGWGPVNRDYVRRVTGSGIGEEVRQRAGAARSVQQPSFLNTLKADLSGRNGEAAKATAIADVKSGRILVPENFPLPKEAKRQPRLLHIEDVEAYNSGLMSSDERADLLYAVENGEARLPKGAKLTQDQPGIVGRAWETVTGKARETQETRALPDWGGMPELNQMSVESFKTGLGTFAAAPDEIAQIIKAQYPQTQVAQDRKGNYVLTSSVDGQRYVIKPGFRPSDIPRFLGQALLAARTGGVGGVAGRGVAKGLAGRMATTAAAEGALQTGFEATQAATGGTFDPSQIALAAGLGAGAEGIGALAKAGAGVAGRGIQRGAAAITDAVKGVPATAITDDVTAAAALGAGARPAAQAAPMPTGAAGVADDVAGIAGAQIDDAAQSAATAAEKQAADDALEAAIRSQADEAAQAATKGAVKSAQELSGDQIAGIMATATKTGKAGETAQQQLAKIAQVNTEAQKMAADLGMDLPVDIFADNPQFTGMAGLLRSRVASTEEAAFRRMLSDANERADEAITKAGSVGDIAALSDKVRENLLKTHDEIGAQADAVRAAVNEKIPPASRADTPALKQYLEKRAVDLGGVKNLTTQERELFGLAGENRQMTYGKLNETRQEIGNAIKGKGSTWATVDEGRLKKIYGLLAKDQQAHAAKIGGEPLRQQMRQSNRLYVKQFAYRDRLKGLFDKDLQGSIAGKLQAAIAKASKTGDVADLRKMLAKLPEGERKAALATALEKMVQGKFGFNFGKFVDVYSGLRDSNTVYALIAKTLGPEAEQLLQKLYVVSKRIKAAQDAVQYTGKANQVFEAFKNTQGLVGKILQSTSGRMAVAGAAAKFGGPVGSVAVAGLQEALSAAKPNAMASAAKLLASPEFTDLAQTAARAPNIPPKKVWKLSVSPSFRKFMATVGGPRDRTEAEKWILAAMQGERRATQEEEEQ